MEKTPSVFLDLNVKVDLVPSFKFLLTKLIPIFVLLVSPLTIKVLTYMAKTFTVYVQVHNIVPTLNSIANLKYLMETTAKVSTGAILGFALISNVCVGRHPTVQFPQISNALARHATIFRNQMVKPAQLTQHVLLDFVPMACAMVI
jgi:hypothetical protein